MKETCLYCPLTCGYKPKNTWLGFSPIVGMMIQSAELIFFRGVGIYPCCLLFLHALFRGGAKYVKQWSFIFGHFVPKCCWVHWDFICHFLCKLEYRRVLWLFWNCDCFSCLWFTSCLVWLGAAQLPRGINEIMIIHVHFQMEKQTLKINFYQFVGFRSCLSCMLGLGLHTRGENICDCFGAGSGMNQQLISLGISWKK